MGMVVEPAVCDPQSDESLDELIDLASRSADALHDRELGR